MRPISVLCSVVRTATVAAALLISFLIYCCGRNLSPLLATLRPHTADPTSTGVRLQEVSVQLTLEVPVGVQVTNRPPANATSAVSPGPQTQVSTSTLHRFLSASKPLSQDKKTAVEKSRALENYHKTHDKNGGKVSHSTMSTVPRFQMSSTFKWPQPRAVRAVRELRNEQWLADLQSCLVRLPSREVTLLTSNQPYTEVLLNWLIAAVTRASVDLSQVLVIAMDTKLHSLLQERGLVSVLVRPQSLLTAATVKEGIFPSVMMTRLAIIRLLNHWGYAVLNFDTDAILLRDPSTLLHSGEDIIGTFGKFPTDLTKRWGITLCTAVLVVCSSPATEEFWEAMSRAAPSSFSDQGKMNYGLQALGVRWTLPSRNLGSLSHSVKGECSNGLRVSLLPHNVACRASSCTRKALSTGLYVWHKGGARLGEKKREGAQDGGVWFLRSDWAVGCDGKQGRLWLECISI